MKGRRQGRNAIFSAGNSPGFYMFLRLLQSRPCTVWLLAAAAVLAASPCEAQLRSVSVQPDTVDAGSLQTMRYAFTVGERIFSKGGIRIELPVGYAEK